MSLIDRQRRMAPLLVPAIAMLSLLVPATSFGWGHAGHVGISQVAAQALPEEVPAFLRDAVAVRQISEIGAEADEARTTGLVTTSTGPVRTAPAVHDSEHDPAHFIDVDDSGIVQGGVVALARLPATREAFDTAQRTGGQTQYSGGYLAYELIDGFQQVRKDFGMWRAMRAGLAGSNNDKDRAWFGFQLQLREQLIIRDIGYWSHFVADASQPLHVSVHYNGWGKFDNPEGWTTVGIHAAFEGAFVSRHIEFTDVAGQLRAYTDRGTVTIEQRVPVYLAETLSQVEPVYRAAKESNGDNYATNQPAERAIVLKQLAAGAAELRDEIVDAWRQSAQVSVGYPLVRVADVESGRVSVSRATFGSD